MLSKIDRHIKLGYEGTRHGVQNGRVETDLLSTLSRWGQKHSPEYVDWMLCRCWERELYTVGTQVSEPLLRRAQVVHLTLLPVCLERVKKKNCGSF